MHHKPGVMVWGEATFPLAKLSSHQALILRVWQQTRALESVCSLGLLHPDSFQIEKVSKKLNLSLSSYRLSLFLQVTSISAFLIWLPERTLIESG